MNLEQLLHDSRPFLQYLTEWKTALAAVPFAQAIPRPERAALMSVDMINAFCYQGPLASPRVCAIIAPCVQLMERAHAAGLRNFVLIQEGHAPDALEFAQFPPHGILGSPEAEAIPEYQALAFYPAMTIIRKNSLHAALNTNLEAWLREHPHVDTFVVIGNCTDLCVYQLAMFLRLEANAAQIHRRVIVPQECVATYDLPVAAAQAAGAVPHAGDLLDLIFLYSLHLNGIEIVRTLT